MRIRVGLFFGGKSVEHEVSVISAIQVASAMDTGKYEIIPVYITKDNEMYTGADLLIPGNYRDLPSLMARCARVTLTRDGGKVFVTGRAGKSFAGLFARRLRYQLDVAFPVVHGTNVEDGSLQGFLQLHDLPYVGCDVGASASGMDKWTAKCLMLYAGLPVLPGYCLRSASYYDAPEEAIRAIEAFHGYPLIIKPVNLGSSVGVNAARDRDELVEGIELAASFSERLLIEPMVTPLREINCAVLGDGDMTEASECEEPLTTGEILSYADKYLRGGSGKSGTGGKSGAGRKSGALAKYGAPAKSGGSAKYGESVMTGAGTVALEPAAGDADRAGSGDRDTAAKVSLTGGAKGMESAMRVLPAVLERSMEDEIKLLARKAFSALNCSGVARVDFLVDTDSEKVYINEINTIPGSLSFYLWEAGGKSFGQLTDELIQLAFKRHRTQSGLIWSNSANLLAGLPAGIKG